jgi:uncharacterized protein YbbK (DUF523 family)
MKIIVSACLLGRPCRYDGRSKPCGKVIALKKRGDIEIIEICPEQLGGLSTPRIPCEIKDGKVFNKAGEDVTAEFELGAEKTLAIARENGVRVAILKQGSPSCGCKKIYDGTFSGNRITGEGVTARKLVENGIPVFDETEVSYAKLLADGNPDSHHH